jgi:DNA-binding NtrC family response regulator
MSFYDQTTEASGESTPASSAARRRQREARRTARLTVVASPDREREGAFFPLPSEDYFLVGRALDQAGVSVADARLSRLHFRIRWDGRSAAFRIGDAGSKNGTTVNGHPITTAVLRVGDVIRAGDTLFVFDEGDLMQDTWLRAERAAETDLTVLVLGETGTGKEVLARRLHEKSGRAGPFVAINCAAVAKDLIAAELFGHTRGAFSGAIKSRPGLFATAEGGTLLLDEIGDLPLEVQAALLRVLQERKIRPVGSDHEVSVTARVIAATHVNLDAARASGKFREDLYARLAQVVLSVRPLRERRTEILSLARSFADGQLVVEPAAAQALLLWDWPHNVRELRALVEAFRALEGGDTKLTLEYLMRAHPKMVDSKRAQEAPPSADQSGSTEIRGPGRERLQQLLEQHQGNITAVAKELGKVRPQIYRWMKAYGLSGARAVQRKSSSPS